MIRQLVELSQDQRSSTSSSLREVCSPVTEFGDTFKTLVADLIDTLKAHDIAIGLAAPQIGGSLRVAVINISEGKKEPTIVIANPRNVTTSGKKDIKRESCMSLPYFGGSVERRDKVRFTCEDESGD